MQSQKIKNILYVSYTGQILGGGEISLLKLLENLDRTRFNPVLFIPDAGELQRQVHNINIETIIAPYHKIKNPINFFLALSTIKTITAIVRNKKISLIHCNSTGGLTLLAAVAAKLRAIPFIWHVRTINKAFIIDFILACLTTKIVVNSHATAKRFAWMHTQKIEIVYNGVDINKFNPAADIAKLRKSLIENKDNILVGTIGRYHKIKGYKYFLSAAAAVIKSLPNIRFIIAGVDYDNNNYYLTKLKQQAKRLMVTDTVIFTGSYPDPAAITNAMDICVSTSPNEAFGRNIIEGMACAKPFIAFDSGGPREIIENNISGILVKPRDSRALADKIIELALNPDLRKTLGENARKRVEGLFTIDAHAKNIEAIYERALSKDMR